MESIDPTPDELQQWSDVSSVLSWAGLAGDPAETASPAGSFLQQLGFTSTAPVRVLGMISAVDLIEFLRDWKIDGASATPAQRAKAALVGSGARVAAGTQRTVVDSRIAAAAALAAARSATAPVAEPAASSELPDKDNGKSFLKLSAVLDQTSDEEFQLMSRVEADNCFKVYDTRLGGAPLDDQEPTVAQLSAVKHVVVHGGVLYADLGVFGPHAIRMMRKLRLTGLMLGPSGELFRSEMAGPMTYEQWEACFMVFRSAMVMLEFASPSSLDGYRDHVRQYSTRFGVQRWALIFQTDTRARREHAERLRRRATAELTALDAIGVKGAYNPKRPWEYVFRQFPVEFAFWFAFWKRELEDPALLILARALVAAITSEAPVAKTRDQHITHVAGDAQLTGLERQIVPSFRQRIGIPSPVRVYKYDDQDYHKSNRRGVQLCAAFQRAPVRQHVLNSWPISARSAFTLTMVLKTVLGLASQFSSMQAMMLKRERERSRKGERARNPSGDARQLDLLRRRPRLSRGSRVRSVYRPEANSRMNSFVPMTFTLDVVVKSWACLGRNGAILSRSQRCSRARPFCSCSLSMLGHTWHTKFICWLVEGCCVTAS